MVYTLLFFSSKCSLFHNSNVFGSCVFHILYTGCAKIKNNNTGAKRLILRFQLFLWSSSKRHNAATRQLTIPLHIPNFRDQSVAWNLKIRHVRNLQSTFPSNRNKHRSWNCSNFCSLFYVLHTVVCHNYKTGVNSKVLVTQLRHFGKYVKIYVHLLHISALTDHFKFI